MAYMDRIQTPIPGIETNSTMEQAMRRPAASRLATRMKRIMRGKSLSSTAAAASSAWDLAAIEFKMVPAILSVWGAVEVVLAEGSGVSSMEKADGGASVGLEARAGVAASEASSHEGVSPSILSFDWFVVQVWGGV